MYGAEMFVAAESVTQVDPEVISAGMWALIKIAAVFSVMVVLIRRKLHIGHVLLIASVLMGFALGVGFKDVEGKGVGWAMQGTWNLLKQVARFATQLDSLRLLCLVLTITVFGGVMKHVEKLQALTKSLLALLRDRRWAMGALSSLIGLLPMPGGAMISAPMVGDVAKDLDLSREEKTAINHWMRHIWEYVDSLYPGLLMAAAVFGVPVTNLMLAHSPLTIAAIVGGVVFLLRRVPGHQRSVGNEYGDRSLTPVFKAILPVFVIIAAAMIPQALSSVVNSWPKSADVLPAGARWSDKDFTRWVTETFMLAALFCTIAVLFITNRTPRKQAWRVIRSGITLKMTAMVLGVCVMKGMMKASGAVVPITTFLSSTGLPDAVVVGAVLFIVGMLLGYSFGFVAICYPMLLPMLTNGGVVNYPMAAFAFAMGFIGVLLSPVHLCLVLSREHFDATWGGAYKRLLLPSLLVFLTACLMLLWA
jgi:uncharacterized protein